ncbi:MAG: hypothetical protein M1580_01885, partial [Candidatus Parvarchaeota archaeon]|nr:hypothetical protein [Candidatus Parvarchaeota archaeon]
DPDIFVLIISLISKSDIFIDRNKLTFYRQYDKNTSYYTKELVIPELSHQLELANKSNVKLAKSILKFLLFLTLSDTAIKQNNKKDLIKSFKYLPLNKVTYQRVIRRIILSILFLFGSNYPLHCLR